MISTIGKVVSDVAGSRRLRAAPPSHDTRELEQLREAVGDLSTRLHKLEEERDFYRELLDAPKESRRLPPE